MIKLQIIGHIGKDCVVNTVSGKSVINFTVAHSEKYKDAQGVQHERTTWVDCSYWVERTTVAQYLTKGKQVFVEGRPEARSFQRNDGTPGASLSVRVREVQLLGGSQTNNNTSNSPSQANNIPSPSEVTEPIDDLPF